MSDTIRLTNQLAYPVRNDGVVDWQHAEVLLTGTFIVVDDVIDNHGGCLTVTSVRGSGEWAIKHEDLPFPHER
jgi:hypothetical protein